MIDIKMKKFRKLVAVENTLMNETAIRQLSQYAQMVQIYDERPENEEEIINRIGDADAVLISFKTPITKAIFEACPSIRYVGMCCTLYDEKSCNVDIMEARRKGITVMGIKDYGDEGVVEYAISELVRFLHGFGNRQWKPEKYELTRRKMGIIGLGRTGRMLADAFQFLGAEISYYSRTRKPEAEQAGIVYRPLHDLLRYSEIVFTCLPRNTFLLKQEEFTLLGNDKILMNTSIGPTFDMDALKLWLKQNKNSFYFCDETGMGTGFNELSSYDNVIYTPVTAGKSVESVERLSQKVLANIDSFLTQTV